MDWLDVARYGDSPRAPEARYCRMCGAVLGEGSG